MDQEKMFPEWEDMRDATIKDAKIQEVSRLVHEGASSDKDKWDELEPYFCHCKELMVVDGVVLMSMRVVVPKVMRERVLQCLHQAHQGVSWMAARARITVW